MKYFAYGSNMDAARMNKRIGRIPEQKLAKLSGYSLVFNKKADNKTGVGYANISVSEIGLVYGILYEITEIELKMLDVYECVRSSHYKRFPVNVQVNQETVTATTYIACEGKIREGLLPERKYIDHLLAASNLLPPDYVLALQNQKTIDRHMYQEQQCRPRNNFAAVL